MIEVRDLTMRYGRRVVLDGVEFHVGAGEVLLLLGANGAGKSTLLRCLLGLVPFQGHVAVDGRDPRTEGRAARERIGYMPQRDGLHDDMSVAETLRLYASLREVPADAQEKILVTARLDHMAEARVDELSGGMRQRLAFALATLSDPPVLLLDEPTASLDGWSRDHLVDRVTELAGRGKAIVLSTHVEHPGLDGIARPLWLRQGRLATRPDAAGVGVSS